MRVIADFHVHSKYARATSPKCDIPGLMEGAKIKGINLMATGDFTHPVYFEELKRDLDDGNWNDNEIGIFTYRNSHVRFILSTEVSVIFDIGGKCKRMHHILLAPSVEVAAQMNEMLARYGNLKEDGRPTLKISSAALVEELESISKDIIVIPAHVWTPWFSIFGSKGGVDSVESAFEDKSDRIFALETGLSSDPQMNWTISALDKYTLVSNGDAHSPSKLGREANVFDLDDGQFTFRGITDALKTRKGFVKTYEFYPEEGKYHYDGHRNCKVVLSPWESKEKSNICPVCRKKLTVGVMHRVADLADRKPGFKPAGAVPFQYTVPLQMLIAKALGKSESSVVVAGEYDKIIRYFGSEFGVYEAPPEKVRFATSAEIAEAIIRVNKGQVRWVPGYDGIFGELILDDALSRKKGAVDKKQKNLSDF